MTDYKFYDHQCKHDWVESFKEAFPDKNIQKCVKCFRVEEWMPFKDSGHWSTVISGQEGKRKSE